MTKTQFTLAIFGVVLFALFMVECYGVTPRYVREPAVIVNVQDNPKWGFIGETKRTLVKYADGLRDYEPGALGEPGETILGNRRRGCVSPLGIIGDN